MDWLEFIATKGINLPSTYKDFLKMMGHGAGKFLRGSDCFYQHFKIDVLTELEHIYDN
jgi:hypothetical protein